MSNAGVVAGVVGVVTVATIGGAVLLWTKDADAKPGETGDVPDLLKTDAASELASLVCACIDAGVVDNNEIAACALRRVYAESALKWPPPSGATTSHARAWEVMAAWIGEATSKAAAQNVDVCTYLRQLESEPPIVTPQQPRAPEPPRQQTPQAAKVWDPQDAEGFVAGVTFCNDNQTKPYNKNEWTDSGEEIVDAMGVLGYSLPAGDSLKQRLEFGAQAIQNLQRRLAQLGYHSMIGDAALDDDGIVGACTLRVMSFAMRQHGEGKWPD